MKDLYRTVYSAFASVTSPKSRAVYYWLAAVIKHHFGSSGVFHELASGCVRVVGSGTIDVCHTERHPDGILRAGLSVGVSSLKLNIEMFHGVVGHAQARRRFRASVSSNSISNGHRPPHVVPHMKSRGDWP